MLEQKYQTPEQQLAKQTTPRAILLHQQEKAEPLKSLPHSRFRLEASAHYEILLECYALSKHFPSNVSFSDAVPAPVRAVITTALKAHPEAVLQLQFPSLLNLPTTIDTEIAETQRLFDFHPEGKAFDDLITTLGVLITRRDAERAEQITKIETETARELLLSTFGITAELSEEASRELFLSLRASKYLVEELLYFDGLLKDAERFLSRIAPHISSLIAEATTDVVLTKIRKHIFKAKSPEPTHKPKPKKQSIDQTELDLENNQEYMQYFGVWSEIPTDSNPMLVVDTEYYYNGTDPDKRILEIIAVAHELIHVITTKLLSEPTLVGKLKRTFHKVADSSLYSMIQEGVSLAFEYELCRYLSSLGTLPEGMRKQAAAMKAARDTYLGKSTNYWKQEGRQVLGQKNSNHSLAYLRLPYLEGARLAQHLQSNGWTLNDLPFLIHQLTNILTTENGSADAYSLNRIPITKEPTRAFGGLQKKPSTYVRVRHQMRKLKPEKSVAT